jgi:hypothetical protein
MWPDRSSVPGMESSLAVVELLVFTESGHSPSTCSEGTRNFRDALALLYVKNKAALYAYLEFLASL